MIKSFCSLFLVALLLGGTAFAQSDFVVGKKERVFSKILNEERAISVYLPRGYANSAGRYPLLLVLDGYFLWTIGMIDYLSFAGNVPQMVVVAIDSTDRDRDFTPTRSKNLEGEEMPTSGGAKNFLSFLEQELLPYLESGYRLESFRLIAGHSMGGLLVSYALLEKPELFQAYFAMSPTLPWDKNWLIRQMDVKLPEHYPRHLFYYLGMDNQEGTMLDAALAFMGKLRNKKPANLECGYNRHEQEDHISCFQMGMYTALRSLYAPYKLPGQLIESGDAAGIEKHYQNLTQRFNYRNVPSWEWLYFVGHWHQLMKRHEVAIHIFELAASYHPGLADVHLALALAYDEGGFPAKARSSLEDALARSTDQAEKEKIELEMKRLGKK